MSQLLMAINLALNVRLTLLAIRWHGIGCHPANPGVRINILIGVQVLSLATKYDKLKTCTALPMQTW